MDQDATWYGDRPRPRRHCFGWRPSSPFPKKGTKPRNCRPMSIVAKRLHGQDATWYGGKPRPRPYCARWGQSSHPERGHSGPNLCCGQTAGWIKMPLGTKVGLGPGRVVLHDDPAPPPNRGTPPPKFTAHVYCDQTVAHVEVFYVPL